MRRLIFWVIDEQHKAEQQVSEASVKRHMPDIETWCFPVQRQLTWYDVYIKTLQFTLSFKNKTGHFYEQFLFLDSDTYLCEPVYDIFDILSDYDVVSTHAPARQTTDMPVDVKIPDAYPEFNTGVFAYANTSQVRQLFEWWLEEYYKMFAVSKDNDQAPLRVAMWQQGTKAWVLPPEYNFRWGFGGFAAGRIKILHGRSKDIAKLAEQVNQDTQMRTFVRGTLQ